MDNPLLKRDEVVYAETSSKIYPEYKDVLFQEFEEANEIPFNELIVTIIPKEKLDDYEPNGTIGIYLLSDVSSDTISALGFNKMIENKYQSVKSEDLVLLLIGEEALESDINANNMNADN